MQQSPRKFWEVWGRSDALYNRWAAAHGVNNYRLFVLYVLDNHPGATLPSRPPDRPTPARCSSRFMHSRTPSLPAWVMRACRR